VPLAAADLLTRHGSLSRANLQGTFTRASGAAAYRNRSLSRSKAIQRAQPYVLMEASRGRIARLWTNTRLLRSRLLRIVDAHFNAVSSVQSHTARLWSSAPLVRVADAHLNATRSVQNKALQRRSHDAAAAHSRAFQRVL